MFANVILDAPDQLLAIVHHQGVDRFEPSGSSIGSFDPRLTLEDAAKLDPAVHWTTKVAAVQSHIPDLNALFALEK